MTKNLISPDHIFETLLEEIREHKTQNKDVMAVFDLDSTLIEVGPRMTQILRDFAKIKKHLSKYPKECRILERYTHHREDWGIENSLERAGLVASSYEFFKELMHFWRTRFFSNEYLHLDEPLPGAKEFLKELDALGAHISYLTARESSAMLKGTIDSLLKHEFPLKEKNKNLFLKQADSKRDAEFKRDVIKDMLPKYGSLWFFENEPINLRIVRETLPGVKLVYIDTVHSGREVAPSEIATISDFKRSR